MTGVTCATPGAPLTVEDLSKVDGFGPKPLLGNRLLCNVVSF